MSGHSVASRYANAMSLLVKEQSIDPQQFYRDAKLLEACLAPQSELSELLAAHSVPLSEKAAMIGKALTGKVHKLWVDFVLLMLHKHREANIHNALLLYSERHRREHNIIEVYVETSHPLPAAEQQRIEQLVAKAYNKTVEFHVEIRPDLIAGLVLIVDGKMVDLSVQGQLREARKTLGIIRS